MLRDEIIRTSVVAKRRPGTGVVACKRAALLVQPKGRAKQEKRPLAWRGRFRTIHCTATRKHNITAVATTHTRHSSKGALWRKVVATTLCCAAEKQQAKTREGGLRWALQAHRCSAAGAVLPAATMGLGPPIPLLSAARGEVVSLSSGSARERAEAKKSETAGAFLQKQRQNLVQGFCSPLFFFRSF